MSNPNAHPSSAEWEGLIRRQHGVVKTAVARRLLGRWAVQRQLRDRRWAEPVPGILVTHNGPLTRHQRMWVAHLVAPPGSALSGATAAELDGMTGFADSLVHVTIPCGRSAPTVAGVEPHWSRFLGDPDVHPLRLPRRTRLARSVVDMASWARTDGYARAALFGSVQQGLASEQTLGDALDRRGPCKRHAVIQETLLDIAGGIRSVPEREFDGIRIRCRLPEPSRQRVLRRADGRYYLDVDFDQFATSVEVDGRQHLEILCWDADLDRCNHTQIEGRTALRFTSFSVRHRQDVVGDTLLRAARTNGWRG